MALRLAAWAVIFWIGVLAQPGTVSYYELLELDRDADTRAVKRAYRAAALKYHPDKLPEGLDADVASEVFVRVAKAHEVLTDDTLRERYDEMMKWGYMDYDERQWNELDYERQMAAERRPGGRFYGQASDSDAAFYASLAAVAVTCLAPLVYMWISRRGAKSAEDVKRERLAAIAREHEQQQSEEQRWKREEERRRRAKEEEESRRKVAEELAAERERAAKLATEKQKARERGVRNLLKRMCKPYYADSDEPTTCRKDIVTALCSELSAQKLNQLVESMKPHLLPDGAGGGPDDAAILAGLAPLHAAWADVEARREDARRQAKAELARKRFEEKRAEEERRKRAAWAPQELSLLAQALSKHPGGTPQRWEKVTAVLAKAARKHNERESDSARARPVRTQREVVGKARELDAVVEAKRSASSARAALGRMTREQQMLQAAQSMAGGAATNGKETSNGVKKGPLSSSPSASVSSKARAPTSNNASAARAANASAIASPATDVDEWSSEQQACLERALRDVPRGPTRWDDIAAAVPGKTRKQVVRRFKLIKAQLQSQ